jgi:hypothetical protein
MAKEIRSYDFRKKRGTNVRKYQGKYPWEKWFGDPVWAHKTWELTQAEDFPGVSMTSFRQTLRNAAGRRKVKYRTVQKDEQTVILEVLGPED